MLSTRSQVIQKVEPLMEEIEKQASATQAFQKYFTLEEAARLLPEVQETLTIAQQQMNALRDEVVLSKRVLLARQSSGRRVGDAETSVLQEKFERYEETLQRWVDYFAQQGIILRDLDTGLIDFPYHSQTTQQDFLLCWRPHEDGIFYFHGLTEGFAGRHPISLLPD
jgi:hypothetical protein